MSPARRATSTTCPSRRARCTPRSACRPKPHARLVAIDLAPVRARAGRGGGDRRSRHPGREQYRPGGGRRAGVRRATRCSSAASRSSPSPRPAWSSRAAPRASRACDYAPLDAGGDDRAGAGEAAVRAAQPGKCSAATCAAPAGATGSRARLRCGGQEHFYLEGQVALALPGERGEMLVHSSTQHPTEVQHLVAAALGVPDAAVTVELRRLGGGFGGKETQAALYAIAAALLARATGRPVKLRADRDDDMIGTGKRHDFLYRLRRRLRRRRPHRGARPDARLALRHVGGPVRRGQRPRGVPLRQRLLPAERAHRVAPLQDQHRVQHRVPRLRRPAGHVRGRGRDRRRSRGAWASIRSTCASATSTARRRATSRITA